MAIWKSDSGLHHQPFAARVGIPTGWGSLSGTAVICGPVYPSLLNKLIFCDFTSGKIWSLKHTGGAPIVERLAGEVGITAIGTVMSSNA